MLPSVQDPRSDGSNALNNYLQLFSRLEFEANVGKHRAERHARGFTCWGQFVAMLFCQLGHAQSLREICWSLSNLVALLRQQLFVHRDLWTWLDDPFQPPPASPVVEQLNLGLR